MQAIASPDYRHIPPETLAACLPSLRLRAEGRQGRVYGLAVGSLLVLSLLSPSPPLPLSPQRGGFKNKKRGSEKSEPPYTKKTGYNMAVF